MSSSEQEMSNGSVSLGACDTRPPGALHPLTHSRWVSAILSYSNWKEINASTGYLGLLMNICGLCRANRAQGSSHVSGHGKPHFSRQFAIRQVPLL